MVLRRSRGGRDSPSPLWHLLLTTSLQRMFVPVLLLALWLLIAIGAE